MERRPSEHDKQGYEGQEVGACAINTIKEAGVYTGVSPHTLYAMVSQRRVPYVKVGRLVKFDVELWISGSSKTP